MPTVAEIDWHVAGDIGGTGISRFRFTRQDTAAISGADCNAAAAASFALLTAMKSQIPNVVTWSCQSQVNIYDAATGLVTGPMAITSLPANVVGSLAGSFGAGVGARLNWKTATLAGRRLIKGCTFIVPLGSGAYATNGGILPSFQTTINAAAATYINAMTTATLYPVVWHRPKKGTFTGGLTGIVFTGICSGIPGSLRSRRS